MKITHCVIGDWVASFNEKQTQSDYTFHLPDGTKVRNYGMMHQRKTYHYIDATNELQSQILFVPYQSSNKTTTQYVCTIILPNRGINLDDAEQELTAQLFNQLIEKRQPKVVDLYLPKFKMEYSFENLKELLEQMGIQDAFNKKLADFQQMTSSSKRVYISDVKHQAVIDVNESGFEAAAVTIIETKERAYFHSPEEVLEFKCDRPFIFMIREETLDTTLFVGKFMKPSNK
ncbi:unnamed protein product [Didymodactylos carnosus]|uniref:Serpin domain-containing protein n=1 Tax=Didymodactylos carnosus TaxID=1234261 RepID=A0A815KUP3_9BILA|nr:unnamed protein product [Didymodactylos carnosus]CAF1397970.1 unnamed protein product [Didymodactylos carnosus]CAF4079341.1 unnamed protein product [Didymodactylos carnosus]CAF4292068.1 unnamed protein product [Didymodactylos carnosus]